MARQFDPTELTRMAEEARRAVEQHDPAELTRVAEETRRAVEQFDPAELTRVAEEARRAVEQFDPAELTRVTEEARRAVEQFDPAELTRVTEEARRVEAEQTERGMGMVRLSSEAASYAQAIAEGFRQLVPSLEALEPAMLGGNQDLADALGRVHARAEKIVADAAGVEFEQVEALVNDVGTVTAATPKAAEVQTRAWLKIVISFVVGALIVDPAKEAFRYAVAKLLVTLLVMAAESTLPTTPSAPTLRQPEALEPDARLVANDHRGDLPAPDEADDVRGKPGGR